VRSKECVRGWLGDWPSYRDAAILQVQSQQEKVLSAEENVL
jgi:hypothetical protein